MKHIHIKTLDFASTQIKNTSNILNTLSLQIIKKYLKISMLFAATSLAVHTTHTLADVKADIIQASIIYDQGDYIRGIELLKPLAEAGHVVAQKKLAFAYNNQNWLVENGLEESFKWYEKAANQGLAYAQHALGDAYFKGNGTKQNKIEAIKWYQKAAEQGFADAQYNLGGIYLQDIKTQKTLQKGIYWYTKAAEQGNVWAQYALGLLSYSIEKNHKKAFEWFEKAAMQNLSSAQAKLGFMYAKGQGVEKNEQEAIKWYQKAAEHNDQYNYDAKVILKLLTTGGI